MLGTLALAHTAAAVQWNKLGVDKRTTADEQGNNTFGLPQLTFPFLIFAANGASVRVTEGTSAATIFPLQGALLFFLFG